MSIMVRRTIPTLIVFILGIYMIFSVYFNIGQPYTGQFADDLSAGASVITAFMMWVGTFSLLRSEIVFWQRDKDKGFARRFAHLWTIGFLVFMVAAGVYLGQASPGYEALVNYLEAAGDATAYSMLMFSALAAFYRAYRVRSTEAFALVAAGFLMVIGNTPLLASTIPGINTMARLWLLEVLNKGTMLAMYAGGALGTVTLTLRILIGKERAFLGTGIEEGGAFE